MAVNLTREELRQFAEEQIDLMVRWRLVPEWRREAEVEAYLQRFYEHAEQERRSQC